MVSATCEVFPSVLTPQNYETVKSFARPEMKVLLFFTFFLSDFSLFYIYLSRSIIIWLYPANLQKKPASQ